MPHLTRRSIVAVLAVLTAALIKVVIMRPAAPSIPEDETSQSRQVSKDAATIRVPEDAPVALVSIDSLHPTQLAVGMAQVHVKLEAATRKHAKGPKAFDKYLRKNPIPVIRGPGGALYIIDHHHLAAALLQLGVSRAYAATLKDLSQLPQEQFWQRMADENYLWQYDIHGNRISLQQLRALLPGTVAGCQDDPYRSLATRVRKAGGYSKSPLPFSEFIWANHLRRKVVMPAGAVGDEPEHISLAIKHALDPGASQLPGYHGNSGLRK